MPIKDPEERAQYLREWRQKNRDKVRQYNRKCDRRRWSSSKHDPVTYFIKCRDFVKIGTTTNLSERMGTFQVASPYELELLGTCDIEESIIHEKFQVFHHRGEWYILHPKLLDFIKEVTT